MNSSRLPAISVCWSENPVTLPPGRERLATRPLPIGSSASAKTIGMEAVACFKVATAPPYVTMTSTYCCANSAAISATRSGRPSDQRNRYRNLMSALRPFIPQSRTLSCVAANDAKGHVWTAPAVQEESDLSAKRSGAAMYAACFSRRGLPRRDAAAVAAGPDVIR